MLYEQFIASRPSGLVFYSTLLICCWGLHNNDFDSSAVI